ncbi:cyclic amp receptor 2 [Fusarium bulbicola]|nr:cyclic amp receptor 2 [Fusarium bulbicola]
MTFDIHGVILSLTLAGSVISFFATTSVLISFVVYRHHIDTFRHMLILELMLFEFTNNSNNSTSGIWHLKNGELSIGRLCTVNGFIVCICVSICILPLATSIIPTFMGEMQPVGGNWCWIATSRPDLRYTMAHGWRIFVIFSIVAIYIYIWAYLKRRFGSKAGDTRQLRQDAPASLKSTCLTLQNPRRNGVNVTDHEEFELDPLELVQPNTAAIQSAIFLEEGNPPPSPRENRFKEINLEFGERTQAGPSEAQGGFMRHRPTASKSGTDLSALEGTGITSAEAYMPRQSQHSQTSALQTNASEFHMRPSNDQVELEIKRMLLLNAYPFMYVLLWAPGLINRLMEASGNPNSKTINVALQAPTQFIGLANALTYGFNHYLRDRLNDLYFRPVLARIKGRIGPD